VFLFVALGVKPLIDMVGTTINLGRRRNEDR